MPRGPGPRLLRREGTNLDDAHRPPLSSSAVALSSLALVLSLATGSCTHVSSDYKVFYCVHQKKECVSPDHPVSMPRDAAVSLMKSVATKKDAFLGFTDSKEVTLQFYTRQPHRIWVEIPVPAKKASSTARS